MKQTAVEWLFKKLTLIWHDSKSSEDILKEANKMFEEQIKDAYQTSHISMMTAEQYIKEKYYDTRID